MAEDFKGAVMDAALIGAAQRVEHYEIAGNLGLACSGRCCCPNRSWQRSRRFAPVSVALPAADWRPTFENTIPGRSFTSC